MEDISLEIKNAILALSDSHLDAKYEVADDNERDQLIIQKRIKKGHVIYHAANNKRYRLYAYPVQGSVVDVEWKEIDSLTKEELNALYENKDPEQEYITAKTT